jgi:phosphate-selective porin OprO/OprP
VKSLLTTLILVLGLALPAVSPARAQDGEGAPAEPERKLTQSELQREIDILQREIEDLIVRIGDKEPTDRQWDRLRALEVQLADYRRQLAAAQAEVQAEIEKEGEGFQAKWIRTREALRDFTNYDVNDGMFRLRMGVRFQIDGTAGWADDDLEARVGEIPSTARFRRGRIFAVGRFLRQFDYLLEYDFAADNGLKDAYIEGAKYTKWVRWRIGQFKEPFSLDRQNSAYHFGFLEWPLPVQAIAPGRNLGLMVRHTEVNERLFWAVSATTNGKVTDDNRSNATFSFTGRVTGLPQYRDKGRRLVHLGLSLSIRNPKGDTAAIAARPEARFAPFFADTGEFSSEETHLGALEFATVQGPWWVQAEALRSRAESPDFGDPEFGGAYVEVGWFLTGESRFYRTFDATFGRLTPNTLFKGQNPFSRNKNGGAVEFVGRYSTLDLNSGVIQGGEMRDLTLGMNWYLSSSSRFMVNWVRSKLVDVGVANIFLLRYEFKP